MKLSDIPEGSKMMLPIGGTRRKTPRMELCTFHHLDGMYSLITTDDGNHPVHLAWSAPVKKVGEHYEKDFMIIETISAEDEKEAKQKTFIKRVIKLSASVLIVLIIFSILNPFVIIGAGERGVVLNWGAVSNTVLNEGIHFRVPIKQKIEKLDVKNIKHEVDSVAYSKDIQTVDAKVALNYHLDPNNVNKLWQEIGEDYTSRVIDPSIQESVKAATAQFTAQELIEQRPKVKDEIRIQLTDRLNGKHIIVDDFSIVNFDFSVEYEKAIELKQVAQQNALKAENDLTRIKTEAEQRVAQAQAEAEAIKIQAQSVSQQGGAEYVQLKSLEIQGQAIAKWDGRLPQQFVPGSAVPFLNLNVK